jgi:hypothetical protein
VPLGYVGQPNTFGSGIEMKGREYVVDVFACDPAHSNTGVPPRQDLSAIG